MNPADEIAAKIGPTERLASIDKLDEQLRVSVEALLHPSPPRPPVEELDDLLSAINHHLDQETSERKKIYYRLGAIDEKATVARVRRLPARDLYCCCSHRRLAILRPASKADDRDKRPEYWVVARGEADDCELGPAAWLDKAVGRSRKRAANGREPFESAPRSSS
jgi:hypothetical protein